MEWYTGEIAQAVQKAIAEKKAFIVFVKGDNDDSKVMEELWDNAQICSVCSTDKCVSIIISADSVAGQQFSSIYPILSIPSTYLINNRGFPIDIIPGKQETSVLLQRLGDGIQKVISSNNIAETNESINSSENKEEIPDDSELPENIMTEMPIDQSAISSNEEQIRRLQEKREKMRKIKAEKEREKAIEEERKRREIGQELSLAQKKLAENQAKILADEIAKQRKEERFARDKVREQIRLDRAEKNAKREAGKKAKEELIKKKVEEKQNQDSKNESHTSRLQFRLPDGSTVSNTFHADAVFSDVEHFVRERVHGTYLAIRLTTVFPKREFTEQHSKLTLRDLQLVPNASIIVSPGRVHSSSTLSLSVLSIASIIFAPIIALFNFILSLFGGNGGSRTDKNSSNVSNTSQSSAASQSQARAAATRRRIGANISSLRHDSDDENATWNGNSTQQM